jgi:hypothetical protein
MVDLFDKELKFDVQKHKIQFLSEIKDGAVRVPKDVIKRLEELKVDTDSVIITLEAYDGR